MDLTTSNIIISILALFIIIYAYNVYIKPIISNLIQGKTSIQSITEAFSSQYSSLSSSSSSSSSSSKSNLSNTVQFDTNTYLRDDNKPIILNNQISLPVIKYSNSMGSGSYEELVGEYFRKHIYPIQILQSPSNIDTLYKFINDDVDISFISEEVLARYIKRDCKYLTRLIADTFNINYNDTTKPMNNLDNPELLDRLYPQLNIEAIGVGFHIDFYLIVNNFSNIVEYMDIIKGKNIGVLADSYYYYIKTCSAYGIDKKIIDTFSTVEPNLESLIKNFKSNKYDGIFIVCHPKNKQLLKLSLDMKLRYIHIQKKLTLDSRNNPNNIAKNQQGTSSITPPSPPSLNTQAIYSQSLMNNLNTVNIVEDFNTLIKKYFQHITPRTVDLNKFHKSGNSYSYLETFSTRMILVIRKGKNNGIINGISNDKIEYLTRNYINNLEKMRNKIDIDNFDIKLNNFSSLEFNYEELVSFDKVIPLADGARKVYKDEGLVYYEEEDKCVV